MPTYVCHRCFAVGEHWKQNCPTMGVRSFALETYNLFIVTSPVLSTCFLPCFPIASFLFFAVQDENYDPLKIKKAVGIPKNQLEPVAGPDVPGAMLQSDGTYVRIKRRE